MTEPVRAQRRRGRFQTGPYRFLAPSLKGEAGPRPNPGGWPIGGQSRTEPRNDHLAYAITWYGLAAALVVIYVLWHLRRRQRATP